MNSKKVTLNDIFPVLNETLTLGGSVKFGPKGVSMMPLIEQGIDNVIISPVKDELKKYDVPLYKRRDGHFVLHRIVDIKNGKYVMCGDNQTEREYGVTKDMIIGVMTEIHKKDKIIKVTDLEYRKYSKKRVRHQYIKYFIIRVKRKVKRVIGGK